MQLLISVLDKLSPYADEEPRRPGQRPTTAMLGNEVLNKEQLYDLFQQILGVKKFEHQLLYNAMQLENSDEQAAAIRRELDARQEKLQEMQRVRWFFFSFAAISSNFYT